MKKRNETELDKLPVCAADFIKLVIKKMRYRKKVRVDVQAELAAHFEDELQDCKTDEEKEQKSRQLIEQFGDAKLLGTLLRRAKKRCRPLWQKTFIRTLQVLLMFVAYFLICLAPLLVGKPEINTDYVQWLNNTVRAGHNKEDNARPLYDKAAEYYVKEPNSLSRVSSYWPGDMNEILLTELMQWLSENQKAIELFREAAEKPYFWYDYKSEQTSDQNEPAPITPELLILPNLGKYRRVAQTIEAYILLEAYNGDTNQAFEDSFALIKFGQNMQGKGLLVEQVVGVGLEVVGHSALTTLLARIDLPANLLESVQRRIEHDVVNNKAVLEFDGEKAIWYDMIQRNFTKEGNGRGRPLLKAIPLVATNWDDTLWMFFTFDLPSRREFTRDINTVFEQLSLLLETPPANCPDEIFLTEEMEDKLPFTIRIVLPAFKQTSRNSWKLRTSRRSLPAILAALRFCKENGKYPDNLEQLASAGYLRQIPLDPYSGRPLRYKKIDNGFVLYSVGLNLKDDGGQVYRDEKGNPQLWYYKFGDAVFWPVQK